MSESEPSWWASLPWTTILLVALGVLLLAAVIWGIVVWRRKRAQNREIEDTSPPIGASLRELWADFYANLPEHAQHFPTFVVLGENGSGKSSVIDNQVDWRGQAHQSASAVDGDAPLQLYLGPDLVVHEVSAGLLRDDSQATKSALRQLWRNIGTTATVVLVIDATTLLDMDEGARRELAQRVRSKIGLFPADVREQIEIRMYLSKLDRVPGYLQFVAALGIDHPPLALSEDATKLLRSFDDHLSYMLVQQGGTEFDQVVSFYDRLPELVTALGPMLAVFTAKDELFGARYHAEALYLGSRVPHSQIGRPFSVDHREIEASISRHESTSRRRALALGIALFGGVTGMTAFHSYRVHLAKVAITDLREAHGDADADGELDLGESRDQYTVEQKRNATEEAAAALRGIEAAELLWLRWANLYDKNQIAVDFEKAVYDHYLEPLFYKQPSTYQPGSRAAEEESEREPELPAARPQIEGDRGNDLGKETDRAKLIYLTSMIVATEGTELANLIIQNRFQWAERLGLDSWVILAYVESSTFQRGVPTQLLPQNPVGPGDAWMTFLYDLRGAINHRSESPGKLWKLVARSEELPTLLSADEYALLERVRKLMSRECPSTGNLLVGDIVPWEPDQYDQLRALRETLRSAEGEKAASIDKWGLVKLVRRLARVQGASERYGFERVTAGGITIDRTELDSLIVLGVRNWMTKTVLDRIARNPPSGGREFFDLDYAEPEQGIVSGFGGRAADPIDGVYTRTSFEREVSKALEFANQELFEGLVEEPVASPDADAAAADADAVAPVASSFELSDADREALDAAITDAAKNYAVAYRDELLNYYESFEFDPGSEMALPFAIKPFMHSSSWFTSFLLTFARNASPTIPPAGQDPGGYFSNQRDALEVFQPLVALLAEDAGQLPGLAPYQAIIAALQQDVAGAVGETGDPEAHELIGRLSTLGAFALGVKTGLNQDYEELISEWLYGAGIEDSKWYVPFLAPVRAVETYGLEDVEAKLATAWKTDVRPLATPLLDGYYPFNPQAAQDIDPDALEQAFRMQGEIPGEFWQAFDRLIRPALQEGKIAMVRGVRPPGGMLAMARDLEAMSQTLWDDKGERVELAIQLEFGLLPMDPFEERYPALTSVSSGGGSVYGFNQKASAQTLRYKWWEQGLTAVTLTMKRPGIDVDEDPDASARYRLSLDGGFSLFRLLDRAHGLSLSTRNATLTEIAMHRGTRCDSTGPQRTRRTKFAWKVPLGRRGAQSADVVVTLVTDAWEPFAIRSCL